MILNIVTPTNTLVTDLEVKEVSIPGSKGELSILTGHAPLVTQLETGVLTYKTENSEVRVAISWGYCEVSPKSIKVLAETAETKDILDTERATKAVQLAEAKLASGELDLQGIEKYQRKLKRGQTRLDV